MKVRDWPERENLQPGSKNISDSLGQPDKILLPPLKLFTEDSIYSDIKNMVTRYQAMWNANIMADYCFMLNGDGKVRGENHRKDVLSHPREKLKRLI